MDKNSCTRACLISMISVTFLDLLGVGIVIPIMAVLFLAANGIMPAGTPLATRTLLYGLLIATYPLMQFFSAPILGALSDRHGRKKLLIISIAGTMLGYVIFAIGIMTKNITLLFAGRIIDGLTGGNISIAQSAIADVSTPETKVRNFGLIGMAFGLGFIIGPFLGGQLANPGLVSWFSQSTPFWFAALLSLANIIMLIKVFPETLQKPFNAPVSVLTGFRNIGKAFRMQNLRTMFLVIFLITFGFSFFTQFVQVFLIDKFQFTEYQIGNFFAYIGLWVAIAQGLITRPVSRRFQPGIVLRISIIGMAVALFMLLLPTKAIYLFLVLPFLAIFNGLTQPNTTAIISNQTAEDSQGEVLGINQSIQALGQAIPPLIAGVISAVSINLPILVASAVTFLAWLTFVIFYRQNAKETFHEEQ